MGSTHPQYSRHFMPLDRQILKFNMYGLAHLVGLTCTPNEAQKLLEQGSITKRQHNRFLRIWGNSTFRSCSRSQDMLYALGGQEAIERRYKRAQALHKAWYRAVLGPYLQKGAGHVNMQ